MARRVLGAIKGRVEDSGRPLRFMEVCGTHTAAFSASGLRTSLTGHVHLTSGPGCPVCVTSAEDIDRMIALASCDGVIVCTFGDMVRVPGTASSLEGEKARGCDVRVVYSPTDAVDIARREPDRLVVFLGVGFETTVPALALALGRAASHGLTNFRMYPCGKTLAPALKALLEDGDRVLDGLILPGHVSTVMGRRSLDFIATDHSVPAVIAGFEVFDLLHALDMLVDMVLHERPGVKNAYRRAVTEDGNTEARQIIDRFFLPEDARWRGLGTIGESGLGLRPPLSPWDARPLVSNVEPPKEVRDCRCGDVLTGRITPTECSLHGTRCRPEDPVGPCMVSSEGACAIYHRYHGEAE